MKTICEILDKLKSLKPSPLTRNIKISLESIQKICNELYANQFYYGNAALNRQMLLDPVIALFLTPDVLFYIFTNETNELTIIARNKTPQGVGLKDAIYFGFKEGLEVIRMMPNNEVNYDLDSYEEQQQNYIQNTLKVVKNIQKTFQPSILDLKSLAFDPTHAINQYDGIVKTIYLLKKQGKSEELLQVPGYTAADIRSQVEAGFEALLSALGILDLFQENLDSFCEKLLSKPEAIFHKDVPHLLLDRVHLEAALEEDALYELAGNSVGLTTIFRVALQKLKSNPKRYSTLIKEQLMLRIELIEKDLKERFKSHYEAAQALDLNKYICLEDKLIEAYLELEKYAEIKQSPPPPEQTFYKTEFKKYLKQFQERPFGSTSRLFPSKLFQCCINVILYHRNGYLNFLSDFELTNLILWISIEEYLSTGDENKSLSLEAIKQKLQIIKEEDRKHQGQSVLIISRQIIKNVYLSPAAELTQLFRDSFPLPDITVFHGASIPKIIAGHQKEIQKSIDLFMEANQGKEKAVLALQRQFRSKKRKKEWRELLVSHPLEDKGHVMSILEKIIKVPEIIADANRPYVPKCEPVLANRIMQAVKKVKLFTTIRHITSETHLVHILNNGLYGRRSLSKKYTPFKEGAFVSEDYLTGDSNVVCFAPKNICPTLKFSNPIEIVLDVERLQKNPCMFFKQRDFLYPKPLASVIRKSSLASTYFNSDIEKSSTPYFSHLGIWLPEEDAYVYSSLPNALLVSTNMVKMHQILTLNFFRFLDALDVMGLKGNAREILYQKIRALSDEQLTAFLQEIGEQISDTAEVDFYGSYKLDFSAVHAFKSSSYELNCATFIRELKEGNFSVLGDAQKAIPNLFKSYRFLDHLLSAPHSGFYPSSILEKLIKIRKACPLPMHLKPSYCQQKNSLEEKAMPSDGLVAIKNLPQ